MTRIALATSLLVISMLGLPALTVSSAFANPLDDKSCEELGAEQDALRALGVEGDMAKGHEWARTNLAQSDLNIVKRFIDISERVKFRCGGVTKAKVVDKPQTAAALNQPGALKPVPPLPVRRVIASPKPVTANATAAPAIKPKAVPASGRPATGAKPPQQKPATPQKAGNS